MTKKSKLKFNIIFNKILPLIPIVATLIFIACVIIFYIMPTYETSVRKQRITTIFKSLELDKEKYQITAQSIFSNKKIGGKNSNQSYTSMISYVRFADVNVTVKELKEAISKTDFKFYEEPFPDSLSFMHIYKSPRNEYLRVSIDSKTRADEFYNRYHMGLSTNDINTDSNLGPSNIVIKVNLDGNNE